MDEYTFQTLSLLIGLVSTLGLAFIGYLTAQANRNAEDAARIAEDAAGRATLATAEVRATLAETTVATASRLSHLAAVAQDTHTLVNSSYGTQLAVGLAALERIAALTGDPNDRRLADDARARLEEHNARQAVVDTRPSPEATKSGRAPRP